MRAAVYRRDLPGFSIETVSDPRPQAGELLIRVLRCGICGSDLHMAEAGSWQFPDGAIPGHEYAGEVLELGAGVSGFAPGDLVTALPALGCGRCIACDSGNLILCADARSMMGGYGEVMRVAASSALRLPATRSAQDGALIEPLAVGLYGVRQAGIKPSDRVLILGAGSAALAALYWARRQRVARIVMMSRSPARAQQALRFGADRFLSYGDDEQREVVEALGGKADVVLECVGRSGFLMKAIEHVRTYGRVASMGFCMGPDALIPALAAFKGVTLSFPLGYSLADFQHVADHLDGGHVDPGELVSSVVSLEQMPAMFDKLLGAHGETKVHIAPG